MAAADYYIDLTNGNNARTGLKIGNSTIDSTADTTHFVDDALTGADDYINGSYFYNVTRALGSLITDFVALTDTVTLTTAIAGMTAGDTYYILDAWLTLEKYTTTTARTAGDIAYVRANTTETVGANDIVMDEDGTALLYISIIGCDGATNNPWVEASTVRPIIDFGDAQYQILLSSDDYWKLANLDVIQSADTNGNILLYISHGTYLLNCIVRDNSSVTASSKFGVWSDGSTNTIIESCQFSDNLYANIKIGGSIVTINNCIFNGGIATTDYGIYVEASTIKVKDCTFGQTTAHDLQDIYGFRAAFVYTINCLRNKSTYSAATGSVIFAEDDNQVKGANVTYSWKGTVTKSATVRTGGATSSAQLLPSSLVGLYAPLSVAPFNDYDFKIYKPAGAHTITPYIRADSAWATYPTAAQLYVEASYLSAAATAATRATVVSTAVLSDGTTWVAFPVTFTSVQDGYVYIKIYLGLYTATEGILVDMKIDNLLFEWAGCIPIPYRPNSVGFSI